MSVSHLMSRLSLQATTYSPASPMKATSSPIEEFHTCSSMPSRDVAYSPPPSPTRMSSVPRFDSPILYYSPHDTPSLLDETLPSSLSSPSVAYTPMPYATTRNHRPDSSSFIGLGFTGLLKHDGSMFDGMGALPKVTEGDESFFWMDDTTTYTDARRGCPEHQEDAWRKRMSLPSTSAGARSPFASLWSPPACSSPAERAHIKTASPLPAEPDADDVFFTRSPPLGSPLVGSFGVGFM